MEYNTTQEHLILPEYGRNIQMMAKHILTIEDREKRNRAATELVGVMGNLFPHLRDAQDFKHKLWDHLAILTQFNLDVDYPYEITLPGSIPPPQKPAYNNKYIKYRHYGHIAEGLILKAIELEEGDEKQWLIQLIANHMKKQYITWNKNTVNDDIIYKDLKEMSKGNLNINTNIRINVSAVIQPTSYLPQKRESGGGYSNRRNSENNNKRKYSGGSNRNSNNNNRKGR